MIWFQLYYFNGNTLSIYLSDQQSYLSFKTNNTKSLAKCKEYLEAWITDIGKWTRTNKTKVE